MPTQAAVYYLINYCYALRSFKLLFNIDWYTMFKDKTKSNAMAPINEANLLEDLILLIKRLQQECTRNSTSRPYLDNIIHQLSQPNYYIENSQQGYEQVNRYLGLLLLELMHQDQPLFNHRTQEYIRTFEETIAPRHIKQPQRGY